jgi:hypothetical protein
MTAALGCSSASARYPGLAYALLAYRAVGSPRQRGKDKGQPLVVTIVSDNAETLDGLQAYLRRAGVGVHGTRQIASAHIAPASSAVVFFPDDFESQKVVDAVLRLQRARPAVLPILVTGDPRRFESMAHGKGRAPIIIPKPAWGWSILDTIRGHLEVSA